MASQSGTLYVGFTNNVSRRTCEHQLKLVEGFTKKYNCDRLVYFESFTDVNLAIAREKQLKTWSRYKKYALIKKINPTWLDLSQKFQQFYEF